mgnify:CR=1 FL=1
MRVGAAVPAWMQVPGLDAALGLRRVGGQASVYRRLLQRFVDHHGQDAAHLREAARTGRRDEIAALISGGLKVKRAVIHATIE